jgi:glycosyltransferase involved in cell wall biosynthesis
MKLVIQNGSHVWGGNEKWLATVAAGLLARGHGVVVSCPRGPVRQRLEGMGVPTASARPRGDLDLASAAHFAWWLRSQRPDALLLTSWRTTACAAAAAAAARVPRLAVRMGISRSAPQRGPASAVFRRRVDALIVNSPEVRDQWLGSAPWFPAPRVHVVLNGLADRAAERPALRDRLRRELGVRPGELLVGGVGHVAHRKGFDVLLRAFAAAEVPNARLVIGGDGPELPALRALAADLGVAPRVHWLGAREDGPDVVAGLDVFVLASRSEGMANVMLEAMSAGVPVIATRVSGVCPALAEQADAPAAGWIVPPDDPAAMAASLRDVCLLLAAAPADVQARADEARRRVARQFGIDRMIDECECVLFPSLKTRSDSEDAGQAIALAAQLPTSASTEHHRPNLVMR